QAIVSKARRPYIL
uniref:Neurotensin n=3 Tax=Hyloidea TaxID=8417 RepID=NEUT_RHIMB|nr:RecName: Full=Neurotensin; Short=NT [Rhinella marina]